MLTHEVFQFQATAELRMLHCHAIVDARHQMMAKFFQGYDSLTTAFRYASNAVKPQP